VLSGQQERHSDTQGSGCSGGSSRAGADGIRLDVPGAGWQLERSVDRTESTLHDTAHAGRGRPTPTDLCKITAQDRSVSERVRINENTG
jgi:hypothetical protein